MEQAIQIYINGAKNIVEWILQVDVINYIKQQDPLIALIVIGLIDKIYRHLQIMIGIMIMYLSALLPISFWKDSSWADTLGLIIVAIIGISIGYYILASSKTHSDN